MLKRLQYQLPESSILTVSLAGIALPRGLHRLGIRLLRQTEGPTLYQLTVSEVIASNQATHTTRTLNPAVRVGLLNAGQTLEVTLDLDF